MAPHDGGPSRGFANGRHNRWSLPPPCGEEWGWGYSSSATMKTRAPIFLSSSPNSFSCPAKPTAWCLAQSWFRKNPSTPSAPDRYSPRRIGQETRRVDGNAQIGWEKNTLYRIVALLLALADLAERAAGASRPVRCRVLWALRHADAVANEFVTGCAQDPAGGQFSAGWTSGQSEPADAITLAVSLRAVALMVRIMAGQIRPRRFRQEGRAYLESSDGCRSYYGAVTKRLADAALSPVQRRDTS